MLHHLSLPARRSPYAPSPSQDVSQDQTLSHAHLMPYGVKRSRVFSHVRPYSPDSLNPFAPSPSHDKENLRFQGAPMLSPICSEDEEPESFDPTNSKTWAAKPPPFLHNGSMLPVSKQEVSCNKVSKHNEPRPMKYDDSDSHRDDVHDSSILPSPSRSSPRMVAPDCDQFLKIMDEKLQIGRSRPASPYPGDRVYGIRSTSSSYPSQSNGSTRVQSPDSAALQNRLSLTNLSRFSKANDRLSNLRSSSSPSLSSQETGLPTENHEVMVEATTAIAGWQDEIRPGRSPYYQYKLAANTEARHSDFLFEEQSPETSPLRCPKRHLPRDAAGLTWEGQYDGVHETYQQRFASPDPAIPPPSIPTYAQYSHKQSKRRASHFSLRSLTNSLSKRPRLGFRKWASNVYQEGNRRLSLARQKWKQQAENERKAFDAWRARHRWANQGESSPGKGKSEKSFRALVLENKTCGNDEWWKEGVSRYEAPKWMLFRGSVSRSRR